MLLFSGKQKFSNNGENLIPNHDKNYYGIQSKAELTLKDFRPFH